MNRYIMAALAALAILVVPACSGGSNEGAGSSKSAASKLLQLDPPEARQKLMEAGYTLDQNGFREAVDFLDADSVGLFIAAGFDSNAMADALSYPVNRAQAYEESKLPAQLENYYADPAYRSILATMFEGGLSPNEPLSGFGYTTSLFAESLRIGDQEFIDFLRGYEADWSTKPGCYQHNPRCKNPGTMAGWLFYIPGRTKSWSLEAAFDAYERLIALGVAEPADGDNSDPYLMASIAFNKFLWELDNPDVDALWQAVGSPRIILPYGTSVEDEARDSDPDRAMGSRGSRLLQREYLLDQVFPCIADNGGDYYACLESPPEED